MEKILNTIKIISNLLAGIFFLLGAIFYVLVPSEKYPPYMYLICAIFFFITGIVDTFTFLKYYNINKN